MALAASPWMHPAVTVAGYVLGGLLTLWALVSFLRKVRSHYEESMLQTAWFGAVLNAVVMGLYLSKEIPMKWVLHAAFVAINGLLIALHYLRHK